MATSTWSTPSTLVEAIATASLNSLANTSAVTGSAIDNSSSKNLFMQIELYLASVDLSAQTNPGVDVYLLTSLDGTNFDDDDTTGTYALTIPVAATNATHRKMSGVIQIPPGKFKVKVVNSTGAALASSGNTVKFQTFGYAAS
jgi:hypothetical protein